MNSKRTKRLRAIRLERIDRVRPSRRGRTFSSALLTPELAITDSLRLLDSVLNASLSPDGKRLLVLQGMDNQEQVLFFDAASLKPLQ
jgi:hypothetical protein